MLAGGGFPLRVCDACHRGEKPTFVFLFFNDTSISLEVIGVSKNIVLFNATLLNILCRQAGLNRYRIGGILFLL
jgi:hypothetical protein